MDHILDNLGYIDEAPSEKEKAQIEGLIQQEISSIDTTSLHPRAGALLPGKWTTNCMMGNEVDILEASGDTQNFSIGGLDLSRYSDMTTGEGGEIDQDRLLTVLSYSDIRQRSLDLLSSNGKNQWLIHNDSIHQGNERLKHELKRKRNEADGLVQERKRQQKDFAPLNSYLTERWREGIQGCISIGAECARLYTENQMK